MTQNQTSVNKSPIEFNERTVTTIIKNKQVHKCVIMSDDEIEKLWLCRDFIFGKNYFKSQQSINLTSDTYETNENYTKVNSDVESDVTSDKEYDNNNISEKRLVS